MTKLKSLEVWRTFTTTNKVRAGILAQNSQGVFFQYDQDYLSNYPNGNLSPFKLVFSDDLQLAKPRLFEGLHSVFSDCLPDGWGRLLMDRVFQQHNISPFSLTSLDRLAYVGDTAIGALSFQPNSNLLNVNSELIEISALGTEAQAIFEGQTDEILMALAQMGSSGGARPKAQIYFPPNVSHLCRTQYQSGDEAWIVKFTSSHLPLKHQEGLCEAVYLSMAKLANIQVPEWKLLTLGTKNWLATKRFDCVEQGGNLLGRKHIITACGLLEANFREPSLDYIDLIKASNLLCADLAAGQAQFRRAMFNLFALNQDDHSKNWSFIQEDEGQWQLSPFYDVTFSPTPYAEHMTSFNGFGKNPPCKAIQSLANQANLSWKEAMQIIDEIQQAISLFAQIAKDLDVDKQTIKLIQTMLNKQHAECSFNH